MIKPIRNKEELAAAWILRVDNVYKAEHSGEGGYGGTNTDTDYIPVTPDQIVMENGKPVGVAANDTVYPFATWGKEHTKYIESWSDDDMDYSTYTETYLFPLFLDTVTFPFDSGVASLPFGANARLKTLLVATLCKWMELHHLSRLPYRARVITNINYTYI